MTAHRSRSFSRETEQVYAECESNTAGPLTPTHLVEHPAGSPMRRGGGLAVRALCGRDLEGWHTGATYTATQAHNFHQLHEAGTPGGLCARCVAALGSPAVATAVEGRSGNGPASGRAL